MSDERQDPVTEPADDEVEAPADDQAGGDAGGNGEAGRTDAAARGGGPRRRARPLRARGGRRGRATRALDPARPCLNCGDPTPGAYCPTCGQRKVDVQVSVRAMVMDVLEDQFILDRRLPRTLNALFFKPGLLTVEHVNGRIASYIRPFRLYLVSSVLFFLLLSFFSLQLLARAEFDEGVPSTAADSAAVARLDSLLADTTLPAGIRPALVIGRDTLMNRLTRADSVRESRRLERENWLDDVSVKTGFARADTIIQGRLEQLGSMEPQEALTLVARDFFGYVPTVMFVLLPIFAVVLKLLYIRRRRYYAEHFVFLLHTHSFVFVLFILLILLKEVGWLTGWVVLGLLGWIVVYVVLALKRVYGQGWLKTLVKYWILGWVYFWILVFSIPVAIVVTLLLG